MVHELGRVLIIGGGIGGLSLAAGLLESGIEASVYEQAPSLGRVGAGLTLWANALRALRKLGLAESVIASGSRIHQGEIRNARGRTLAVSRPGELEERFGEPTIAIHRAELHGILLSALPASSVRLGEKCVRVEQDESGVTVHFESGRSERAGLLVAADGIHSVVRGQLFPEVRPRYAGYTAWRGVVRTEDSAALGVSSETWGPGSRFGILRIDETQVYWFATANAPAGERRTADEQKDFLRKRFRGWHHPIQMLIESTPADKILHTDIYDIEPLNSWRAGRVVLLGDAAHATTPNLGQGGCMAIESGVVLARCLKEESELAAALARYEAERMPRTRWITEQSWKIGRAGQWENPLACGMRDLLVSMAPESMLKKQLARAVGFDA
jgi:2-polyprenyl-6-methoxyphenol hydroxylase-like FAD-dependent oxidoreductase